ncbi:MAG TPA: hypothetical protein EYP10_06240 [Armatimonadetes bacterium]|nr:hypothetical protein [Armatimonadota bacterium]
MRLPKLVRPRLLFRKDDIDRIRERIARYPRLFDRYLSWLQRQVERPNFLPQGITRERVGGRTYELGWRVVACLFASLFLNDDGTLARSIKPIIDQLKQGPPFDLYNEMFHFNMPFFPGAMAVLLDLATLRDEGALEAIRKFYTPHIGEVWVLYNGLCALEEPLTERERAIVFMTAMWMTNVERYFDAHCGKRGGNWWVSPWTGCQCPLSGFWHAFLYLRNFLGEERVLEKKCFREFLTHHRYVASRWCKVGCLAIRGPVGEPARWLAGVMSHNALEMKIFGWREFVEKLNGELPQPEAKAVDELFRKRSAIVIPLALALGWYDPSMPEVDWTALPTTMLFDGEGEVAMRSGWDERSNFIYFTCGVRDVVYRNHPNHFHILKGGDMLIGTLSLWGDHVLAVPSWGNVVVVDDEWAHRWRLNVGSIFPRASEFPIINRYTLPYRLYRIRDKRLYGFSEMGIGGSPTIGWSPLNFHQHQDDLFMREGNIVAYETTPAFDYVAGDATNAWELEKVQYAYRQIIFIKPDVVVIYDRMRLGRTARCTRWLAAVPTRVVVNETTFTIKNGESALWGMILMPKRAIVKIIDPAQSEVYRYLYCRVVEQRVLEITPPKRARRAEYLVVMRISDGIPKPLDCKLSVTRKMVNVAFAVDGKDVAIAFARSGIPGGFIRIVTDSQRIERPLTENINDG